MIQMHIVHEFAVRSRDGRRLPPQVLHENGEAIMGALLDLEDCNDDVCDAATSSETDRGVIIVELLVTANSEAEALNKSLTIARTAIHATGGSTPGWTDPAHPTADFEPQNYQLEYV
jgi:hypothetical protein